MTRKRTSKWVIIAVLIIVALWAGPRLVRFYTDWLWFGEVGYLGVFWRGFWAKIIMSLIVGMVFFGILAVNCLLAVRMATRAVWYDAETRSRLQIAYEWERILERWLLSFALVLCFLIAYAVGKQAGSHWFTALLAFHPTSFGKLDPVFGHDLSFYVFQLPLVQMAQSYLSAALILSIIFSLILHYLAKAIRTVRGVPAFAPHVKAHISVLLAAWLAVKGWDYMLQAYNLLYSNEGVVFGATYTDVHARLFACYILLAVAVLGAIAVLINLRFRGFVLPIGALTVLFIASIIASIYPAAMQRFQVAPSEQTKEAPYIARNIEATRFGFNLGNVNDKEFPALQPYTEETLTKESATIKNVRLWDHRPLLDVYTQKQRLQPYYQFHDVDIDRYMISDQYRQVMLSAREMSLDSLPSSSGGAADWQNEHIFYTHGYAAVLSPVNEVTAEGEPELIIRDIPPVSEGVQKVTQPGLYFGELFTPEQYSLVRTNLPENDYPISSSKTATTEYRGTAGIAVGGSLSRLAMSLRFANVNLLLSENIKADTKIIMRRSIGERVTAIAPFLGYDADPYLAISRSGKLYWIQDAYTLSSRLPYSQPFLSRFGYANYIRNSVKVVIDAYNGTTQFFIMDEKDPLLGSLRKVFPNLFIPKAQMPEDLNKHLRYPEELFNMQARVYSTYHMTDPQVFYKKADRWEIATEGANKQTTLQTDYMQGDTGQGEAEGMQAYYVLMRLPGEDKPEFILMIPFTPLKARNMAAWMAARCDDEHYGELIAYEFTRGEQVPGPIQFEAGIDQHGEISKLTTLWNQAGSEVVRGNLLVIPLGHSLLYVEPIFLKAKVNPIPQLKLVVIGRKEGDALRVYFGPSLERALATAVGLAPALTAESLREGAEGGMATTPPAAQTQAGVSPTPTPSTAPVMPEILATKEARAAADKALEHYRKAQERLRAGDLAGYQKEMGEIEPLLKQLAGKK